MIRTHRFLSSSILVGASALLANSPAAAQLGGGGGGDQDCAIWLCLPFQFPEGCSEAKKTLYSRMSTGKTPLPDYSECSVGTLGGGGSYEVDTQVVATCNAGFTLIIQDVVDEDETADPEADEDMDEAADEETTLIRTCQKCEDDDEGICVEEKPTYTEKARSITVTIGGEIYPPYKLR